MYLFCNLFLSLMLQSTYRNQIMSVNYSAGLSPYDNKGKCGLPEKHDDVAMLQTNAKKLADLIKSSKITVVHTGAGLSTAAGIPDFRGPTGVWTLEQKGETPHFDITFEDAIPTFTHRLLVVMEKIGLIHYIVSQNVDGLHVRSGFPRDRLAELHGNMFAQKCQLCSKEQIMDHVSPTMGLKLTGKKCAAPKCRGRECRGMLRDTILDWEDALPDDELEMSENFCKIADLSIVMGSSLQILPAGNLPILTKKNGGKVAIINLQPTKKDKSADLRIHGYLDEVLKIVAETLDVHVPPYEGPIICLKSSNPLPLFPAPAKRTKVAKTKDKKFEDKSIVQPIVCTRTADENIRNTDEMVTRMKPKKEILNKAANAKVKKEIE